MKIAYASLERVAGIGETLARTLAGLVTRIAAKTTAYTYAFLVNRRLGRPQGQVKEADLQHSTILLANLWVKKGSGLVSEGCVY